MKTIVINKTKDGELMANNATPGIYKTCVLSEILRVKVTEENVVKVSEFLSSEMAAEEWLPKEKQEVELQINLPTEEIWERNTLKKVSVFKGTLIHSFHLRKITPLSFENVITLNDGNFLIKEYGKYKSNLSFLSEVPAIAWTPCKPSDFNLDRGTFYYIKGEFFTSKKGTKCFRVNPNGKHILLRDSWGGAFEKYRGNTLPKEGAVYYRRASSNGGGCGYDYAVYPANWRYTLSEEDI